jgi:hypothetical protein
MLIFKGVSMILRFNISENPAQGCRIFLVTKYKTGKNIPNDHSIYQRAIKYNKRPCHIPNGQKVYQNFHSPALQRIPNITNDHRIYQRGIKYNKRKCYNPIGHKICQHFSFSDLPKYTLLGIFGIQVYHLATR